MWAGRPEEEAMRAQVSVILPVHNAEPWLDECLRSVWQQDFEGSLELSVFNDASKDKSMAIIEKWKGKLEGSGILVVIGGHDSPSPRGVGYSKNQAIAQSSGSYLCFLDSDDVMMPQRVRLQLEAAVRHPTSIIGCQVRREPPNSTERYTRWINQLAPGQLLTQVFTSNGPTVVMPTWFCSRAWFSHVGPFDEGGQVHHLDPPSPLPGRAGFATLGNLHYLERRQAGPPALPQPHSRGEAQGGCLLRCRREQDQEGLLLLRGLSGKAQAPGAHPALPSRPPALRHLREAGPYWGCI
ncbi:UDP-GlcNAc:betaGal beta-1,3-N-acetylglucosaminyltransferase-like protein 1 isoform X4 [Myotis daubentonii]|uniref:UDP-GlcNAc:betaGal beta-1,3-N-acetylglucosaminyltransferase-like protein 1 isoform X4 n=1 Tax=Myotis daubentonii TaxID=98922 RepID=UPI002873E2F1|nr:UDP-GlcNAc:betaGal beta-1,3-N-acetylglucosaminyltransferase-like protein 1 isoform X4 [Myotis daubentonii]